MKWFQEGKVIPGWGGCNSGQETQPKGGNPSVTPYVYIPDVFSLARFKMVLSYHQLTVPQPMPEHIEALY